MTSQLIKQDEIRSLGYVMIQCIHVTDISCGICIVADKRHCIEVFDCNYAAIVDPGGIGMGPLEALIEMRKVHD